MVYVRIINALDAPIFTAELFDGLDAVSKQKPEASVAKKEEKTQEPDAKFEADFKKAGEAGKREKQCFEAPPLDDVVGSLNSLSLGLSAELDDVIGKSVGSKS